MVKFRLRRSKRQEGAQGMVEFALILPLLLLVVFGIIELGRLLVVYSSVGTASREAARYASAAGDSASGAPYFMDCGGIRSSAQRVGVLVGIQSSDIQISYDEGHNPTSTALAPVVISTACPPPNGANDINLGDRVVVNVSAQYQPLLPLVGLPPFTISSDTGRTIVKDVDIEGWPAGLPTNTPNYALTEQVLTATASFVAPTLTAESWSLTETAAVEEVTQTAAASETSYAATETAVVDEVTQTAVASETSYAATETALAPTNTGPPPTATETPETPEPTETPDGTPTPSLTPTSTASPTATQDPCPNWTYSHIGEKIIWTIINSEGSNSYTLQSLTVPWSHSNNGTRMIGVEFGTATIWNGSDTYPSSFNPTGSGGFEYAWQAPWSIGAPEFSLPAGVGTTKDITMSWNRAIGSIDGSPAVAVFVNNTTGAYCTVQQTFIYTP